MSTAASILFQQDTVYSADSIEFCPNSEFSNLIACGTYQLEPPQEEDEKSAAGEQDEDEDDRPSSAPHRRLGRCLMYEWDDETNLLLVQSLSATSGLSIYLASFQPLSDTCHRKEVFRLDQPAILDMKWSVCVFVMMRYSGAGFERYS